MNNTVHMKKITVLAAALGAAVAVSFGASSALAAPLKNAESFCRDKAGGTLFDGDATRYTCAGNDSTKAFSFMKRAQGQCVHSFKGLFSVQQADETTGDWRYTCLLP